MLIHSASQLLTLAGGPQRGSELGRLGIIEDGALLVRGGQIVAAGTTAELHKMAPGEEEFDAAGRVVMPGFVDAHTHLAWAGDRAAEFELRTQGKTYLEIQAAGGGIISTVKATRQASIEDLLAQTRLRSQSIFKHGTTTAEAKTGYGLELDSELKLMEVLLELDKEGPLELAPTFLGAHAIAPEYKDDAEGYTGVVCEEMLPAVREWWELYGRGRRLPFVDAFCEVGAFNLAQSRRILETGRELGFPLKLHADEFENLGGTRMAVELGAISVDHLVMMAPEDTAALAKSTTVAVSLPCTPFGLAEGYYTPARAIIDADGLLAVASDLNPGTAWCESMQFVIALACRYLKLTPAQAIAAVTINGAAAIGRADTIGSLEPGKQADFLLLNVTDYRQLGYRFGTNLVEKVFKKGKL